MLTSSFIFMSMFTKRCSRCSLWHFTIIARGSLLILQKSKHIVVHLNKVICILNLQSENVMCCILKYIFVLVTIW
ncbi:hypothetical protein Hanom_Chr07g00645581 [Helianthus anomalus]